MYIEKGKKYINLTSEDLQKHLQHLINTPIQSDHYYYDVNLFSTFNLNNVCFMELFIENNFEKGIKYSITSIKEILKRRRKEIRDSLNCKNTNDYFLTIDYYVKCGWSLHEAREKIIEYARENKYKGEVLFDKKDIRRHILNDNPFNMNLDNIDFINNFIDEYCTFPYAITSYRLYEAFKKFANDKFYYTLAKTKSKGYIYDYKEYYLARGYSEEQAIKMLSKEQKVKSTRTIEHYINKGMSEEEAKEARSKTQQSYNQMSRGNKVFWIRRGYDEETAKQKAYEFNYNNSVWAVQYWINKGMSEDEAYQEMLKYNWGSPLCKCHKGDIKLYNNAIERGNFHRILTGKINAFNDSETYTEKFKKTAANRKSKTEERCFNMIKENVDSSINNEPYIVIFPPSFISSCDNAKYYACDGYIEYNGKIIIVEYDSGLFHDKENDEKRDNDIFYLDDNVLGILRITEKFFLSIKSFNKDKKYEEIKNAIEDIKSVRRDRIIL